MRRVRAKIAMLLSLAIALAPVSVSWAAADLRSSGADSQSVGTGAAGALSSDTVPTNHDSAGSDVGGPDMADCERMTQGSGHDDCPCCGPDKGCPQTLCLAKCFHLIGALPTSATTARPAALRLRAAESSRPPGWSSPPQPPPPRA